MLQCKFHCQQQASPVTCCDQESECGELEVGTDCVCYHANSHLFSGLEEVNLAPWKSHFANCLKIAVREHLASDLASSPGGCGKAAVAQEVAGHLLIGRSNRTINGSVPDSSNHMPKCLWCKLLNRKRCLRHGIKRCMNVCKWLNEPCSLQLR